MVSLKKIKKACKGAIKKTKAWINHYGEALKVCAKYYALIRKKNKAVQLFLHSIEHHSKLGRKYELAKDYYEYGNYLKEVGDKVNAEGNWHKAYNLFKEIDSKDYIKRTKRLLDIENKYPTPEGPVLI